MRDRTERRIRKLVERLDAEEFSIEVAYDTNNRLPSGRWRPDWTVRICWAGRGWRNYPSDERALSGCAGTLTEALDQLETQVNGAVFRHATAGIEPRGDEG